MARRTKYHVDTMTRLMDSHKQFMGGLKTVDTDDSLKGFFLRDAENISLSEFGFLERRYGLVNDANFEFVVPQVEDEIVDPFTGDRSFKDRLQGYFEYVRPDKVVETIIFYNGRLYLNKVQVTRLYQYPQQFDPKLGLYNNNISETDFRNYLLRVHNYTKFNTFDMIDDLFSTGREVEGVRIENRMFFFTGIYPLVYEGTGEFYILPEFVTNFAQLALFSHNLHTADLDKTYIEGFPASDIANIDITELDQPYFGDVGYAPMFPYMVGEGRGLDLTVNFKVPKIDPYTRGKFRKFLDGDSRLGENQPNSQYLELIPEVYYRPAGLALPNEEQRATVDRTWTRVPVTDVKYEMLKNGNFVPVTSINNLDTTVQNIEPSIFGYDNPDPDRDETEEKLIYPSFFVKDRVFNVPPPEDETTPITVRTTNEPLFITVPENPTPEQLAALTRTLRIKILNLPTGTNDIRVDYRVYQAGYDYIKVGNQESRTFKENIISNRTEIFPSITITAERTTDYLQFVRDPATDEVNPTPVNDPAALWTCNKVLNHYGKLMAYGSTIYPDRVFIGHPTFVHYFPFFFTRDFQSDDQRPILQITPFMNILVVQNETYTWGLKGIDAVLGAENFYTPFVISPIYGTIAPRSVRPIRNQLFFLSADGIVSLQSLYAIDDQYNVKHMDTNIQNIVPSDPDAVAIQYDDQYWIHFPNTPTGITLRYHVDLRAWMKDTYFEYNGVDTNGKPQESKTIFNGVHKYIRKDDGLILITNPMKLANKVSITDPETNYRVLKLYVDYSMATDLGETPRTLFETSYLDQDHPFNEKRYMEQKMDFTIQNEYHLGKEPIFRDPSIKLETGLGTDPFGNPIRRYTMYRLPLVKNHEYELNIPNQTAPPYSNSKANIKRINVRLFDIKGNLLRTLNFQEQKPPTPSIFNLQTFVTSQQVRFGVYNNDLVSNNINWRVTSTAPVKAGETRFIAQGVASGVPSNTGQSVIVNNVPFGPLELEIFSTRSGQAAPAPESEKRIRQFQLEDGIFDVFVFSPLTPSLAPISLTATAKGTNNVANAIELNWIDQNPAPGSTEYRVRYRNITAGGELGPILGSEPVIGATTYTLNFNAQQATALQGNIFEFEVSAVFDGNESIPATTRTSLQIFSDVPGTVGPLTVSEQAPRLRFNWTDVQFESFYEIFWRYTSETGLGSNIETWPTARKSVRPQNSTFFDFTTDPEAFQNLTAIDTNAIVEFIIRGRNANGVSVTNSTREGIFRAQYPVPETSHITSIPSGFRVTIPTANKTSQFNTTPFVFEKFWEVQYRKGTSGTFTTVRVPANGNNFFELKADPHNIEPETLYTLRFRGIYEIKNAQGNLVEATPLVFTAGMIFEATSGQAVAEKLPKPVFSPINTVQQSDGSSNSSFTLTNPEGSQASANIHYLVSENVSVSDVSTIQPSTPVLAPGGSHPINIVGLEAGKTFYIFAKSYPISGANALPSDVERSAEIVTNQIIIPAPGVPSQPTISNLTSSSVTVSWSAVSGANIGYDVLISPGSTTPRRVTGTSTNYSALTPSTSYSVQVRAVGSGGTSAYSTARTFTTLTGITAPPVPTGLAISNIAANSATATWNAVQAAEFGYDVRVNPGNLIFQTFSSTSTTRNLTGLAAGTSYTAEVRSVGSVASAYSSPVSFTTVLPLPSAPTFAELETTAAAGGYLIQWNSGANATSYDVQLATSSNFAVQTLRLDLNPNNVLITGLSYSGSDSAIIGTRVYARVRARNASGVSAWVVATPVGGVIL